MVDTFLWGGTMANTFPKERPKKGTSTAINISKVAY